MLSLNPWDILWTIVNLLVLYAIFRKFLFQPVTNIIHEREDMINKQFEDAQKQQDDAAQMKSEYENQLKGAREKADQIILDAKTRAQEEYNNKMEATRAEADHMLEKAKSDIANEQEKATRDAQAKIAELALLAAKKIMKTGEAHDAGSSK